MVGLKKTQVFHKKKKNIQRIVLGTIGNKEIIYGERALNARFPNYLDKQTKDYDVYSPTPKKDAREAERALDKNFGGDYFYTTPAKHGGTYKVRSKVTGEGYADFTKKEGRVPYDKIRGKKYAKLSYIKKERKAILKDPESKYRHIKDRDAINRIRLYEKMKRKRKRRR